MTSKTFSELLEFQLGELIEREWSNFSPSDNPEWLSITGAKTVASSSSLVVTNTAGAGIKVESAQTYTPYFYNQIWLELGNWRKNVLNSIESFYVESSDGLNRVEFKSLSSATNAGTGFFVNGVLVQEFTARQHSFNSDLNGSSLVNRPCTYGVCLNLDNGVFSILTGKNLLLHYNLDPIFPKAEANRYKVGFTSDSGNNTISSIKLRLTKSL